MAKRKIIIKEKDLSSLKNYYDTLNAVNAAKKKLDKKESVSEYIRTSCIRELEVKLMEKEMKL